MIEVVTTFNDGHTRYYAGELVSANNFQPENLKKFIDYGWVKEQGAQGAALAQAVEPRQRPRRAVQRCAGGVVRHALRADMQDVHAPRRMRRAASGEVAAVSDEAIEGFGEAVTGRHG